MEQKKRTQLAFDISPELKSEIKILAIRRNISMNEWLKRAILDRIKKEKVYDNQGEK